MRSQEKRLVHFAFLLIVSAFGLVISASFLDNPAPFPSGFAERRAVATVAYGSVCVAGILAVLFPAACFGVVGVQRPRIEGIESPDTRATRVLGILFLHGHHPPGADDKKHEIRMAGKSYCATCFGLASGAVVSLAMVTAYVLSSWIVLADTFFAYVLYYFGVVVIILGLIQAIVLNAGAWTRFFFAMVFVAGTGLMLVATDILTENLIADLFVVLLAIFWLLSRVSSSHRSDLIKR